MIDKLRGRCRRSRRVILLAAATLLAALLLLLNHHAVSKVSSGDNTNSARRGAKAHTTMDVAFPEQRPATGAVRKSFTHAAATLHEVPKLHVAAAAISTPPQTRRIPQPTTTTTEAALHVITEAVMASPTPTPPHQRPTGIIANARASFENAEARSQARRRRRDAERRDAEARRHMAVNEHDATVKVTSAVVSLPPAQEQEHSYRVATQQIQPSDARPKLIPDFVAANTRDDVPERTGIVPTAWEVQWSRNHRAELERAELRRLEDARDARDEMLRSPQKDKENSPSSLPLPPRFRCSCVSVTNGSRHESWCGEDHHSVSDGYVCTVRNVCIVKQDRIAIYSDRVHPDSWPKVDPRAPPTETIDLDICNTKPIVKVVYRRNETAMAERDAADEAESPGSSAKHRQRNLLTEATLRSSLWVNGTTLLIAQSNRQHITHFLEGLGIVNARMIREATSRVGVGQQQRTRYPSCGADDMSCLGRPDRVVSLTESVSPSSWQGHMLHVLMRDLDGTVPITHAHQLQRYFTDVERLLPPIANHSSHSMASAPSTQHYSSNTPPSQRSRGFCFEKVIIPGFYYSIFPPHAGEDPFSRIGSGGGIWDTLRADLWQYLRRQQHSLYISKRELTGENATSTTAAGPVFRGGPRSPTRPFHPRRERDASSQRVILLSKRMTRRRIVDWDVFEQLVRTAAKTVSAVVQVVEFGKHSFAQQATAAAEADILMGLHGADLTNTIFQKRRSVLIEVNPIFFFENRFYDIATALGIEYLAWTCTARSCAFAVDGQDENAELWRRFVADQGIPLNESSGLLTAPAMPDEASSSNASGGVAPPRSGEFMWPWDRYVGSACPQCAAMAQSPVMRRVFYSAFRQSNVRIERHAKEIEHVLQKAFKLLKWIGEDGTPIPKPDPHGLLAVLAATKKTSAAELNVTEWESVFRAEGYDADEAEELAWRRNAGQDLLLKLDGVEKMGSAGKR